MTRSKRILSLLLALVMVLTATVMPAFAGGEEGGTLFADDFSGDLSKWSAVSNGQIVDGKLQLNTNGIALVNAGWNNYILEFDVEFGGAYRGISFRRQDNGDDYFWWFGDSSVQLVKRVAGEWIEIGAAHALPDLAAAHHLKLVVDGGTIQGYVDGVLYNEGNCEDFLSGGFLFLAGTDGAYFDNVQVTALADTVPEEPPVSTGALLEDDFSGDLSKWNAYNAEIENGMAKINAGGYLLYAADGWTNYTVEFDADFGGGAYRGVSFRRQEATGDDYFWWFGDGNTNIKVVKRVGGNWTDISDVKPAEVLTGIHHFKLEVNGSEIRTYIDGNLYNTGACGDFTNGGILLFADGSPAYFDNVKVTAIAEAEPPAPTEPEFFDDFSGDLSKWTAVGSSQIVDGRIQINTNGFAQYDANWTDYMLEFDAELAGAYRGISFRRQNNGDDYFWWFGDSNVRLVKRVGGEWTDLTQAHALPDLSAVHHFKVELQGAAIRCYVDGELYNEAACEDFLSGGFQLFAATDGAYFDNVKVSPVTEEPPALTGVLLEDDFSGDLSQWNAYNAQINDGMVTVNPGGYIHYPAERWTNYTVEFDADFGGGAYRGLSFRRQEGTGDDYFWWFGDGNTNIKVVERTNVGATWTDISDVKPAEVLTGIHHFRLDVNGSEIKTYIDGNLYNTGSCGNFTNGGILLFADGSPASFDNVKVTAITEDQPPVPPVPPTPEGPSFSDDFSGDLSQWNVANAAITDDGRLQLGTAGGGAANGLAEVTVGSDWDDYVLEFDADFNGQSYRGISFRRQENGDDYLWWFGDASSNIQIVKRVGGGWEGIGNTQPGNALLGPHHFKLVVQGGTFKGFVDGELWNTGTDEALKTGGVMFLITYDTAFFDNVVVRQVTDEDLSEGTEPVPEKPDFADDFSADLSKWNTQNGTIADGRLQLGAPGNNTSWAMPTVGSGWTNYVLEFDADFNGQPYRGISFRRQANGDDYLWWFGDGASNIKIAKRTGGNWTDISNAQPGTGMTGTHHIKLVVQDDTFYGLVDGTLFVTGQDAELTSGGVLLLVDYDVAFFDNVVVREVTEEDLNVGAEDSDVPGFTDDFSGDLNNWIKDKASISGGRLKLGSVGGGEQNAYATPTVGSNWTDYVVEFDADFNGHSYRGISFRRQDNGDDYLWWFGDGVSNLQIVKRVGGSWKPIGNVQPAMQLKGTHHFKLVVKGNTFTTFIDGLIYNIAKDSDLTKGNFMFMLTYDAAWFDNVVVRQYKEGDENGRMANADLWPKAEIDEDFTTRPGKWEGQMYQVTDGRLHLGKNGGGNLEAYYNPQGGYSWTDYVVEFDADFDSQYYRGISFRRQKTGGDYLWWFGDASLGTLIMKRTAYGWEAASDVQPAKALSGTHHLKLVVSGDQFLTFVDGVLCNTGMDDTYSRGGIQFFVNYGEAWIDNVVVRAVEPADLETGVDTENPIPDLHEDFEDALTGWNLEKGELEEGKLRLGAVGAGEVYAYAAPLEGKNWTDYVLTVDMNFGGQPYRGISFRRQENGDDYLLWFGDTSLGAQIVKRVGGGWEPISDTYYDMKLGGGEHRIKIEAIGSEFKVYVDGVHILTGSDEELTKGGVLFLVNYEAAWIDNVSVVEPGMESTQDRPDSYEDDPFGVESWQFDDTPAQVQTPDCSNLVLIIALTALGVAVVAAAVVIAVVVIKKKKAAK